MRGVVTGDVQSRWALNKKPEENSLIFGRRLVGRWIVGREFEDARMRTQEENSDRPARLRGTCLAHIEAVLIEFASSECAPNYRFT